LTALLLCPNASWPNRSEWPNYYLPFLVRAGHLKPLGKPAQNARKWFATVEIERMSCDPELARQGHSHRGKADSRDE
jgi:hypothetical protein